MRFDNHDRYRDYYYRPTVPHPNMPEYVRDSRSPVPSSEAISRVMSANKGKDTGPEIALRRALWAAGLRGYRLHWKKAPGRPDIAYPGRKLAIFVHGCYWHRCPHCDLPLPKTNTDFWRAKFDRNQARDERKVEALEADGWEVLTFWECQLKADLEGCVNAVKRSIEGSFR